MLRWDHSPLYSYFGKGSLGITVFKRLASLLAAWYDQPYSSVMAWPDAPLVFPSLDQLHHGNLVIIKVLDLAVSEGQVFPSY